MDHSLKMYITNYWAETELRSDGDLTREGISAVFHLQRPMCYRHNSSFSKRAGSR